MPAHVELSGAVVGEQLARVRDRGSDPPAVRRAVAALTGMLVAEALRGLATAEARVATPVATATVRRPARRVLLVPILRAGLAMLEPALALVPEDARTGLVGMARDERTLAPRIYLESLPEGIDDDEVLVLDVMLATGGSAVAALDLLGAAGARRLHLAAVIAAPEGLAAVARAHRDVPVTVAAVDERLDARGFIVPGLGDAGDRLFAEPRA